MNVAALKELMRRKEEGLIPPSILAYWTQQHTDPLREAELMLDEHDDAVSTKFRFGVVALGILGAGWWFGWFILGPLVGVLVFIFGMRYSNSCYQKHYIDPVHFLWMLQRIEGATKHNEAELSSLEQDDLENLANRELILLAEHYIICKRKAGNRIVDVDKIATEVDFNRLHKDCVEAGIATEDKQYYYDAAEQNLRRKESVSSLGDGRD